jgi:hypothetical protein
MAEISDDELQDLRDTERAYDEICEAVVGAKMIPPLPVILQWKREAERYRWLREPNTGQDYMAANCPIREAFDAWVDECMTEAPR